MAKTIKPKPEATIAPAPEAPPVPDTMAVSTQSLCELREQLLRVATELMGIQQNLNAAVMAHLKDKEG